MIQIYYKIVDRVNWYLRWHYISNQQDIQIIRIRTIHFVFVSDKIRIRFWIKMYLKVISISDFIRVRYESILTNFVEQWLWIEYEERGGVLKDWWSASDSKWPQEDQKKLEI